MTELGLYLTKKSVNKAEISRRTGISKSRITQLSNNGTTKLTVEELCKIALSIDISACDLLNEISKNITLPNSK
ncbi:helix-turn-helix transcriptional regulator [Mucilaginibacter sp. HMF5004]|uniref:helix-turn-helix domain-containing protein n=1 Tax=Mucilaginibacter rivuli TaxID=2857527 RepID=UPI001C5FA307|nr:helix-turn-helix domain-containing protein [Mucilaginibacter rivuli]MBW4888940.1 helix-turn-helix transcriptional regulator [Mucilaginibacter rivuli]